ncbi:MAG: glycerol kinase, partial [Oscillospiraceae bacterium]|nr:glycerol kinase [Oscillospiraceae bacterium]
YIVPAFSGLCAPHWDSEARGIITGLTRGSGRNHIIRAALESIAFQSGDIISAMQADIGGEIKNLKVDGGASNNNFLMQFQADISNTKVYRPENCEATALGAALLAGLGVGFFKDRAEIANKAQNQSVFSPEMADGERQRLLNDWQNAVDSCKTR